ncbi:MAG: MFS transporter [Microbacteriaceae bacterium]
MFSRRALFYWQFTAAIVLPLWVIVGQGLFGATDGWDIVLYIVLGVILGFSMVVIAAITFLRKSVRTTRTVSSQDAVVLVVWHLAIIAYGFYSQPILATVIVFMTAVAFWSALWQLFAETRSRIKNAFAMPELVVDDGHYDVKQFDANAPAQGRIIVLDVDEQHDSPR